MQHKYPEKWKNILQKTSVPKTEMNEGETLKMITHFTIKLPEENRNIAHAIFTVTQTENIATGRHIITHIDQEQKGACQGHCDEIVEYPIQDINILIDEMRTMVFSFIKQIDETPMKASEVTYTQTDQNQTNPDMIKKIKEDNITEKESKKIIIDLLGIEKIDLLKSWPSWKQIEQTAKQKEPKPIKNLDLIASEKALIKKYGRQKIQRLAKKIGYKGEIINKKIPK